MKIHWDLKRIKKDTNDLDDCFDKSANLIQTDS